MLTKIPPYVTEDVALFEEMVGRFMERELAPLAGGWEESGVVERDVWAMCGENGLLMVGIPAEYGGMGGCFAHEAVLISQSGRHGLDGVNIATQNAIIAPYLVQYGSEAQKQRWLPKMATGEIVCAIAMTEPGAGSDLQGIRTNYRREGDEYVLNGQKIFITNGMIADLIIVACKVSKEEGSSAISLICVEPDKTPGFRRGKKLDKVGMNAHDTAELFFDDARVPSVNLLGDEEGQGFYQMMSKLPQERLVVALQSMAMIERALELTFEYVKDRKAFKQRIVDFQSVQFTLAEYKTEATIARVFCDYCIEQHLVGELDSETASMAKLWLTELQGKIIDGCLQLFGGYGYMNEYPIARMYRDARVSRIYGGTTEIMKLMIGRNIAKN